MMRQISKHLLSIFFILLVLTAVTYAQVTSYSPQKPKWSDKITITYNPQAEGAMFSLADDVYAVATMRYDDYAEQEVSSKMKRSGGKFTCELTLPERAGWAVVYFITPEKWDNKSNVNFMIYNREDRPARNAYRNMMFSKNPMPTLEAVQWINEELKAYPDNYAVYQFKWLWAGAPADKGIKPASKEERAKIIQEDLAQIAATMKGEPVDYFHALFFAHLLLKDEKELRATLIKMAERYPQAALTEKCFEEYRKGMLLGQISKEGSDEIIAVEKRIAFQYPSGTFAREWVLRFSGDLVLHDPSLELYVKLARQLVAQEDANPLAHYHLASALIQQKADLKTAAMSVNKAIDGLLRGTHRFHGDVTGFQGERIMSSAFRMKAMLAMDQGQLGEALTAIAMAKQFDKEGSPKNAEREAEIWDKLERTDKAEAAYLEAIRLGSKTAGETLKALYVRKYGQASGFDEYLASKMKSPADKKSGEQPGELSFSLTPTVAKKTATPFTVTTLDGKTYDLTSLRGKVVVLNFWFIGCAGCMIEIPSLNKLAQSFKGQDVVFLALALDQKKELETFLKTKPFDYQIVPEARAIADAYEVVSYPVHVIIDREGRLQYRTGGGSTDVHEKLEPLIRSLLTP